MSDALLQMINAQYEAEAELIRQRAIEALPIMDALTASLWQTLCASDCLGNVFEFSGVKVVYFRTATHTDDLAHENWWVLGDDNIPTAYFRDAESVLDYLES